MIFSKRAPIELFRWTLLSVYGLALASIMVQAGEPTSLEWWALFIPFFAWSIAPLAVPLLLPLRSWLIVLGTGAIAAHGWYTYEQQMFGPGARSTSGIVFVFLPIYQWLAVFILLTLAWAAKRFQR